MKLFVAFFIANFAAGVLIAVALATYTWVTNKPPRVACGICACLSDDEERGRCVEKHFSKSSFLLRPQYRPW